MWSFTVSGTQFWYGFIVDFEQGAISLEAPISESAVFAAPAASLLCFRENESVLRLVGSPLDLTIEAENTTALHALSRSPDEVLIAAGDRDGVVRVFSVKNLESTPAVNKVFERTLHSGPVLSLVLSDSMTLVSGGRDRKIALTPFQASDAPTRNLQLNIRCRGLKTHDLQPQTQRIRLEELMAQAK